MIGNPPSGSAVVPPSAPAQTHAPKPPLAPQVCAPAPPPAQGHATTCPSVQRTASSVPHPASARASPTTACAAFDLAPIASPEGFGQYTTRVLMLVGSAPTATATAFETSWSMSMMR